MVEPDRPQMAIWRMRFACWISKAANTQPEYVIFIAFPRQQWLRERPSVLGYIYSACPVIFCLKREAEVTSKNVLQKKHVCHPNNITRKCVILVVCVKLGKCYVVKHNCVCPFMCGFTCFLAGGHSRLPRGRVYVCVYREPFVLHDVVDGVQFFFIFFML